MMYRVFIYDVIKGYSRLIDESVPESDIQKLKKRYGESSIVIDGSDIIILRTRL